MWICKLKKILVWKFDYFRKCRNFRSLLIIKFEKKNKFAKLRRFSKNCQVFELFVFLIFHFTRDFVNTHICSLILIYFVALSTLFFILYLSYSSNISLCTFERSLIFKYETSAILKCYCSKFWLPPWGALRGHEIIAFLQRLK